MKSLVLITADPATGDLVSTALGHQDLGANTYTVELSSTGEAPATHYGSHTWATDTFVAVVLAAKAQVALPPAPWHLVGLDEAAVFAFCGALIVSAQDNVVPLAHFADVLAANGLKKIPDAE